MTTPQQANYATGQQRKKCAGCYTCMAQIGGNGRYSLTCTRFGIQTTREAICDKWIAKIQPAPF